MIEDIVCFSVFCFLLQVGFSSAGMRLLAKEGNQEASVAPPVTFLSASVQLCPHNHRDKVSLPKIVQGLLLNSCCLDADWEIQQQMHDVLIHTSMMSSYIQTHDQPPPLIIICMPRPLATAHLQRSNVPGTWCKYDIGNYINVSYLHVQT